MSLPKTFPAFVEYMAYIEVNNAQQDTFVQEGDATYDVSVSTSASPSSYSAQVSPYDGMISHAVASGDSFEIAFIDWGSNGDVGNIDGRVEVTNTSGTSNAGGWEIQDSGGATIASSTVDLSAGSTDNLYPNQDVPNQNIARWNVVNNYDGEISATRFYAEPNQNITSSYTVDGVTKE